MRIGITDLIISNILGQEFIVHYVHNGIVRKLMRSCSNHWVLYYPKPWEPHTKRWYSLLPAATTRVHSFIDRP